MKPVLLLAAGFASPGARPPLQHRLQNYPRTLRVGMQLVAETLDRRARNNMQASMEMGPYDNCTRLTRSRRKTSTTRIAGAEKGWRNVSTAIPF